MPRYCDDPISIIKRNLIMLEGEFSGHSFLQRQRRTDAQARGITLSKADLNLHL